MTGTRMDPRCTCMPGERDSQTCPIHGAHTPAPWFDDGYRIYAPVDSADKRSGRVIVEYKHIEDFNPADAPLITAAPEMLQALEFVKEFFNELESQLPAGDPLATIRRHYHAPIHATLDLAIAKAKPKRK